MQDKKTTTDCTDYTDNTSMDSYSCDLCDPWLSSSVLKYVSGGQYNISRCFGIWGQCGMDRGNHYETAFEAYLRDRRLGYVAVDEAKRTTFDDEPIKSIDFIVYGVDGARLLIDVKGRQFPGGTWQNWVSQEDVEGLERWEESFGSEYRGLIVFAYYILPDLDIRRGTADVWIWKGKRYLMRAVPVDEYRRHMRTRSPKWGTVHLPMAAFRDVVRPLREFTHPNEVVVS